MQHVYVDDQDNRYTVVTTLPNQRVQIPKGWYEITDEPSDDKGYIKVNSFDVGFVIVGITSPGPKRPSTASGYGAYFG